MLKWRDESIKLIAVMDDLVNSNNHQDEQQRKRNLFIIDWYGGPAIFSFLLRCHLWK